MPDREVDVWEILLVLADTGWVPSVSRDLGGPGKAGRMLLAAAGGISVNGRALRYGAVVGTPHAHQNGR